MATILPETTEQNPMKRGPLLVRRWGRFVRVNWRKRSFAFNLPF